MTEAAREVFAEIDGASPLGVLTETDTVLVAALADAECCRRATAALALATTPVVAAAGRGERVPVQNPAHRSLRMWTEVVRRLVIELGGSPSARSSMRHGWRPPDDPSLGALLSSPTQGR
jgi:hypothetical protein